MLNLLEYEPHKMTAAMLVTSPRPLHQKGKFLMQPHDTLTASSFKVCSKCKESKPATAEFFHFDKKKKDKLTCQCKICRRVSIRLWRMANQKRRAASKRAWREANIEHVTEYERKRAKANPQIMRANSQHYRATKRKAKGSHKAEDVAIQYKAQGGKCYYCKAKVDDTYDVDHVIPLSRGGSNGPENLVIACRPCNRSKSNKLPHEWIQGGRLL